MLSLSGCPPLCWSCVSSACMMKLSLNQSHTWTWFQGSWIPWLPVDMCQLWSSYQNPLADISDLYGVVSCGCKWPPRHWILRSSIWDDRTCHSSHICWPIHPASLGSPFQPNKDLDAWCVGQLIQGRQTFEAMQWSCYQYNLSVLPRPQAKNCLQGREWENHVSMIFLSDWLIHHV